MVNPEEVKHLGNLPSMQIMSCDKCSKKFSRTEYRILCCGQNAKKCFNENRKSHNSQTKEMQTFQQEVTKTFKFLSDESEEMKEQEKREKNIVLLNVPAQNQENSKDLVTNISNGLGVEITDTDFGSARIIKQSNAPILIKLRKIKMKKDILKKRKEIGCLKMSDCGLAGDSLIYFNEDITHFKQMLYSKARQMKRENRFMYAWVKDSTFI
ncbi:hypothetical protein HHI36_006292 [Cryptolaemus montrouzieri]|uniref:Uncharacterized protein n=1 Tax=Cryptolaemus montrouzieri TaxID=559131 RepID=A0ABD2NWL8_9CUCU